MNRRSVLPLVVVALATVLVACTAGSGGLGPVPTPLVSPTPSVLEPSPDATPPVSSPSPSPPPTASPSASTSPDSTPPPSPADTTIVRGYFFLADSPSGGRALVPVLFEVPATKAVATAAMTALLAGPGPYPAGAGAIMRGYPPGTSIPPGTRLLGIDIASGVATVDLSGEFESGGGSASVLARLSQVVYTLTQFPTVTSVAFRIDGRAVDVFSSEGVIVDHPLTRADFEDQLPAIFVDRPAWGAALGNPARVAGNANVFEAQFRIAIVAPDGTIVADTSAMATCGTGCRGTFDVTIPYQLHDDGWGTLRVYEPSAKDGSPQNIREYPVYLTAP